MKLKLDEHMPEAARKLLAARGCDVETVLSEGLGGQSDPIVVAAAAREHRVFMTLDKGIANSNSPHFHGHAGLVLLRLKHPGAAAIVALLNNHVAALTGLAMEGRIVVLSVNGMRVR